MQVICGGLDAFLDFDKNSSILLSCLSQMSISVIIMLNFGANDRMKNFVFNLFGSYKPGKQREVIQKYLDMFLLLHGPKIRDADNAVQLLSEGFFNLSQQYEFVWASIYNQDLDKEPKFKDLQCSSFSFCRDYIGPS